MSYFNNVMTFDNFNKEVKLFTLGDFFISQYRRLANKFYNENKRLLVRRYLTSFLWTGITVAANAVRSNFATRVSSDVEVHEAGTPLR